MKSKYSKEEVEKAFNVLLDIIIRNGLDSKYKRSFEWVIDFLNAEQMIILAGSKIHHNTKLLIFNSKKLTDELALALYKNSNSFEIQNNLILSKKISIDTKKKFLNAKMLKFLEKVVSYPNYTYFGYKKYYSSDYPEDLLEIVRKRLNVKRIIK